jgi:hypothetical protein
MRTTDSPLLRWMPTGPLALDRERWLAGLGLLGVATLFALYVIVLQRDVQHAQLVRAQAHARAVAEADCRLQRTAESRANCLALLEGAQTQRLAVATPPPGNNLAERRPRLTTASLQE